MDFDKVYKEHDRLIREWVKPEVGEEDVEDVVQEVWMKVWGGLDGFRGESKIETWLYRIVKNHLMNLSRKVEPQSWRLNMGWEEGEEQGTPRIMGLCDEDTPEMELEAEQINQVLKDREEECLKYYANGFDRGEIAALMGVTEGSVRMMVSRAKSKLNEHSETNTGNC